MYTSMRSLRANLAAVLRQAEAGQRVVVTVGGRPVAQVGPIESADQPTLADLAARGLVLAARRPDRPPTDLLVPLRVGTRIDRLLAEVRG